MKVSIETITPDTARLWLEIDLNNRPLRSEHRDHLAKQMTAGLWYTNGDAIRFGNAGNLDDGQHRLSAVVASGVTIQSVVVRGVSDEARATIDLSKSRSVEDYFVMREIEYGWLLAGVIPVIVRLRTGVTTNAARFRVSPIAALEFLGQNERALLASLNFVGAVDRKVVSRTRLIALHFVLKEYSPRADAFIQGLKTGAQLPPRSPILLLREALIDDVRAVRYKMSMSCRYAIIIKAWNAFFGGDEIKLLRWGSKESFPVIAR